ncbi:MAG: nickel transport protein [Candidatus Petromonas sp.]|nr:nickel transport protein [Candidatus Petromonas sp.]
MKNKLLFSLIIILIIVGNSNSAFAHGSEIEYKTNVSYEIIAKFDDGKPMSGGQVTIYAPDNPSVPWGKGICDEEGRFIFNPDMTKEGVWMVRVRKGGHGASVNIQIDKGVATDGRTGYSRGQIALMLVSLLWGCIGTALFFLRPSIKKTEKNT